MDYPDKSKVHIYICDDGNRPEMAELAKKMRVGYFGLADNKEAKGRQSKPRHWQNYIALDCYI